MIKKITALFSALLALSAPLTARADEDATAQKPAKVTPVYAPVVGVTKGAFFGVPVTRVSLAFEGGARFPSSLTVLGEVRIELGQTENGLGAHRLELGSSVLFGRYFRFGGGLHVTYSMIVRASETNAFAAALLGDIGGFGVGAHGIVGFELPLGSSSSPRSIDIFARGAVDDAFAGDGFGWSIGPAIALRF